MKKKLGRLSLGMIWLFILGFMTASFLSCTEQQAQQPTAKSSTDVSGDDDDDDDDDSGPGPTSVDVCEELEDANLSVSSLVDLLCGKGDHSLDSRRDEYYTGSGTDKFHLEDEDDGGTSHFTISSAMKASVEAKDYYDLMKTKFTDPDTFKSDGYEVGSDVEYTVIDDGEPVKFQYKNTKYELDNPASVIEYKAESDFKSLVKGKLYTIATELTDGIDTITKMEALIVVHDLGSKSEIISISKQSLDNSNEHSTSKNRMTDSAKEELKIAFENAEKKGEE